MKIRLLCFFIIFLFSIKSLTADSFNLKKISDIKRLREIIKTTEQMQKLDDKLEVLSFVLRSIDFRRACPCVKRSFFDVLNSLNYEIMRFEANELRTLNSFLKTLSSQDMVTEGYKKQINKVCDGINWLLFGNDGMSPKFIKELIVRDYQKKYACKFFVEIGKCDVSLLTALSTVFKKLYSVGVERELSKSASERFKRLKPVIFIPGGDEKTVGHVVKMANAGTIFLLDAENTKNIGSVFKAALKCKGKNVILIENAHALSVADRQNLTNIFNHKKSTGCIDTKDDIIRIVF